MNHASVSSEKFQEVEEQAAPMGFGSLRVDSMFGCPRCSELGTQSERIVSISVC